MRMIQSGTWHFWNNLNRWILRAIDGGVKIHKNNHVCHLSHVILIIEIQFKSTFKNQIPVSDIISIHYVINWYVYILCNNYMLIGMNTWYLLNVSKCLSFDFYIFNAISWFKRLVFPVLPGRHSSLQNSRRTSNLVSSGSNASTPGFVMRLVTWSLTAEILHYLGCIKPCK